MLGIISKPALYPTVIKTAIMRWVTTSYEMSESFRVLEINSVPVVKLVDKEVITIVLGGISNLLVSVQTLQFYQNK